MPFINPIDQGRLLSVGDQYILKLSPIMSVLSFQSYDDVVIGEDGTHIFVREFRYSLNDGASFTSWTTLTDVALQAVSVAITDVILMEIRYTRTGASGGDEMIWRQFSLDNIQVEAHVLLKIGKAVYDALYGEQKYQQILEGVTKFNEWSIEAHEVFVYVKDDNTILDQNIKIDNVIHGNDRDIDFNILLRTEFGRRLIKVFNDLDINPNTPRT